MSSQDVLEEAAEKVQAADPAQVASMVREATQGAISLLVAIGTGTIALQKFRAAYAATKVVKSS